MRALLLLLLYVVSLAFAQGQAPATPPKTARENAPIDLTGYWTSIVTQDWLYRMRTPKGDYAAVPLNKAARQIADAWDAAKDEAGGLECKSYRAAGLMRIPQKLHITWADDNTLRIDTEAGSQTRLLHFSAVASSDREPTCQGDSCALQRQSGDDGALRCRHGTQWLALHLAYHRDYRPRISDLDVPAEYAIPPLARRHRVESRTVHFTIR
jgi:hypothetical protein